LRHLEIILIKNYKYKQSTGNRNSVKQIYAKHKSRMRH
jgi:hypothetical protein